MNERVSTETVRELLAKATPGPWRVEDGTTLVWGNCDPSDQSTWGMGFPVADSTKTMLRLDEDVATVNAQLIAASPDLAADLLDARERIAWLEQRISEIVEAYDSGNLRMESPEIDLGEDGCAPFHEMWLSYARSDLAAAREAGVEEAG